MTFKLLNSSVTRRSVTKTLGFGLITTPALVAPTPAQAFLFGRKRHSVEAQNTAPIMPVATRRLHIINKNTNEELDAIYWEDGIYKPDVLAQFDYLLRDHHQNKVWPIDLNLLDLAHDMQSKFDNTPLHVISCYRSQKTNDMLRRKSGKAAKNSYHIKAMAMDIRIPGVQTRALRDASKHFHAGGVGYYPRQGFVHMDTGPIRYW